MTKLSPHTWRTLLAASMSALCLLAGTARAANQQEALTFGFFPLVSTVALFKRFGPLKDYLADELGHPISLQTAKDFPTFAKRTAERRYDILVTAPHFAVRAVDSGQYRIRATLTSDVQQLVVVRSDSPSKSLADLAGARVATPPARALMTLMGKDLFRAQGLEAEREPEYTAYTSHNAANEAVIAGDADAAIASSNIIGKAVERGAPLRVLARGHQFPNMATLVATDLPPEIGNQVEQALLRMTETEHGLATLKQIGFPGYRTVTAEEYAILRPYAYPSAAQND